MTFRDVAANVAQGINPTIILHLQASANKGVAANQNPIADLNFAAEPRSRQNGTKGTDCTIMADRSMNMDDRMRPNSRFAGNDSKRADKDAGFDRGRGRDYRGRMNHRLRSPARRLTGSVNPQPPDFIRYGSKVRNSSCPRLQTRSIVGREPIRVEPKSLDSLAGQFSGIHRGPRGFGHFNRGSVSKDDQYGVAHTVPESTTNDWPVIDPAVGPNKWQTIAATDSALVGWRNAVRR